MKIYETELPGIGVRYTLRFDGGREFVVLTRNDETRSVFFRADADTDAQRLFDLDAVDAHKLSDILAGTYFHPVEEGLEDVLENARLRWIQVDEASPLSGTTIREAGIRTKTGVTILGIRRGEEMIADVGSATRIEAGDVLVAVGSEESHDDFRAMLS